MIEKNNQPDYECTAYRDQLPALTLTRDLSAGTPRLREKGKEYLPKEPKEKPERYEYRRQRALLYNAYLRAKSALVGMVFDAEPTLNEDVPLIMRGVEATETAAAREGQLEDCDLAGTHWAVFAKELFDCALNDGHVFLYVDMPPALPEGATLADERNAGRRPYFVQYTKDQAINWRVDGRGRLQQITFKECTKEPDGLYGEQEVTRYRVLRPGSWELYRKVKDEKGGEMVIPDPDAPGGESSLKEIPIAVCYSRKTGILTSQPMLLDMALANVAHYQKYSDYSIYLHMCSRPLLWFKGRDKSTPVETIGAYTYFDAEHVAFAETTGTALGGARQDLIDLQEQMAMLALSLVAKKTPNRTATEERGDQDKEESELATAARRLKDCFELALGFWAEYLGQSSGGSITLGAVEETEFEPQMLQALAGMAGTVFSVATVRQIAAKGLNKYLPEGYNEDAEARMMDDEAAKKRELMPDIKQQARQSGLKEIFAKQ